MLIHATSAARRRARGWTGALFTGPPGAGKSDLALRLMDRGWRLAADDHSWIWASQGALYASLDPNHGERISGLIEVRGLGPVRTPVVLPLMRAALVVRCRTAPVERLPETSWEALCGVPLPVLTVDIRAASAPLIVEATLDAMASHHP